LNGFALDRLDCNTNVVRRSIHSYPSIKRMVVSKHVPVIPCFSFYGNLGWSIATFLGLAMCGSELQRQRDDVSPHPSSFARFP
jgi:hypothetical protein